jgi:hypothetical protein
MRRELRDQGRSHGRRTRPARPILIGATLQHVGNGWLFSAKGGGWEFPAFWAVLLVVQALLGDGAYAWRPSLFATRQIAEAH